ncbi:MAG: hypothetical protein MUO64_10240 [Anaerolineales bacterium]|nr:hypothetical protein [Anaerolineales bacterium]
MTFSTGECNANIDPYTQPSAGILNQTWVSSNALLVEGFVKTFWGGATIKGDNQASGDDLILKYTIEAKGPVTSCNCTYKVEYRISGLVVKEFSISIRENK